jgi:hypothetical protein
MDEGTDDYAPNFVYGSVLRLYKKDKNKKHLSSVKP